MRTENLTVTGVPAALSRWTPPLLQPREPTALFPPGHWGHGRRSRTRGAGPARHAWRGLGGRSRRRLKSRSRRAKSAPRAPDPWKCGVSRESSEGEKGSGSNGDKPRSSSVDWPSLGCGAGAEVRLGNNPEPAARHPSNPAERAESRDLRAREAGSPAPTSTSPTPRTPAAARGS